MSGQPNRYVKDIENFRNEYMEALGLRANLDDMNYQANKNYLETGALPPRSTMKDMRSTAEILMDVEKLKLKIIGDFKGLATPQMIQLVIQRVESSPLNGDGSFFTWFAQNTPELVVQLKKKYTLGIEGNTNDAEQMYLFLQSIYSKTKDLNSNVKSAFDRPSNSISGGITAGDLDALRKQYDEIQYKLVSSQTTNTGPGGITISRLISKIKDQFDSLGDTISTQRYQQIKDIFITNSAPATSMQQAGINNQGYHDWVEYTEKLPSVSSLSTVLDQIKKSSKNSNSELTIKLLNNLSSLLPSVEENDRIDFIVTQLIISNGTSPSGPAIIPPIVPPVGGVPVIQPSVITTDLTQQVLQVIQNSLANNMVIINDQDFRQDVISKIPQIETQLATTYGPNWERTMGYSRGILNQAIVSMTNNYNINYSDTQNFTLNDLRTEIRNITQNAGLNGSMIGAGLKRVGRPKGSGIVKPLTERIDKTQGIKQGHTHVPFGKYIINKNRLDDDIFSFKHVKGYGVKGYPSKKISRNLSNVIKTIIGGGVPKFNELSNLSNDEKEYLHTVASKAGVMDKLNVPTPSKDSMEQDVHQFNVMKGEILAGNDSSVLIKKFKLLLLKLSKNGALPKRECQEIMEDLIQLGY
jgi:hypothetical protein